MTIQALDTRPFNNGKYQIKRQNIKLRIDTNSSMGTHAPIQNCFRCVHARRLTDLDELAQVGEREDLEDAQQHVGVPGRTQVEAERALEEADEERGVDKHVILHELPPGGEGNRVHTYRIIHLHRLPVSITNICLKLQCTIVRHYV